MGERRSGRRRRWLSPFVRFGRRRDGATMLEFGFVAMPFFLLMMGIVENGLIYVSQTNLDFALMETARQVRTGQVQKQNMTASELTDNVCGKMNVLFVANCGTNLYLNVEAFQSFQNATIPDPITNQDIDPAKMNFNPGTPGQVVLVHAYYRWKLITPLIGEFMSNLSGNQRLLQSAAAFKNEPYLGVGS